MKRRLIACRTGLFFILGVMVVAATLYFLMFYRMAAPSDKRLIQLHFNPDLPGFPQIDVLEREKSQSEKELTIRVAMDGLSENLVCHGWLHYESGDPYISYVKWMDDYCEAQFQMIWDARYYLFEYSVGDPLDKDANELAKLLSHWIEEGLISINDILNDEMRKIVSQSPGDGDP